LTGFPAKICRLIEERRFTERLVRHLTPGALHALQRPTVGDFLSACAAPRWAAAEVLDVILGRRWRHSAASYKAEFETVSAELKCRYEETRLPLPIEHAMDDESLFVLYAWIRERKPRVIMETGVLNGHSTVYLLNAIIRNDHGEVHSTDIRPDVGRLIRGVERSRWRFHLLPPYRSRRFLSELVSMIGPIDLFFHDSQHSYLWQTFEYRCAFEALTPTGLLGSDDADGNYAFLDFARSVNIVPEVLMDHRKVTGFIPRCQEVLS
jgi:predicted O-methyltransferase YrrM